MTTGSIGRVEPETTNVPPAAAIEVATPPTPDDPTVTASGERIGALIDGVRVRQAVVQSDARGSLTEMYSPAWGFTEEPLVYVYQATIRPGIKKGWIVHLRQDDRLFFDDGAAKVALYDARTGSPTKGMVNELFVGSANRALIRIPAGVFHAVVNVGEHALRYVNMPTRPYLHDQPDKHRLPADTDAIPYRL
jgi:dTDP-4-dehydrorhamnose 3,5-epimerase